jgi:uncharacterized membrane protein HdeD (DUF308 family)
VSDDDIVSLGSKSIFEVIYIGVTIWFLFHLANTNYLIKHDPKIDVSNAFEVVGYNNGEPILLVFIALALVIFAVVSIIWYFNTTKNTGFMWQFLMLTILSLIANVILISWIWHLINNPILKAVIVVIIAGIILIYGAVSKS